MWQQLNIEFYSNLKGREGSNNSKVLLVLHLTTKKKHQKYHLDFQDEKTFCMFTTIEKIKEDLKYSESVITIGSSTQRFWSY